MTTEPNNEVILWACEYLVSLGYTLKSKQPENVQNTPWSYVARFATTDGFIYLKQTPEKLALEASITQILREQFSASVPEVIAHNEELHCFLMKDAGTPMRGILKKRFDVALYCEAIDQFTSLQLAVTDHITIFLDLGVPDWRLDKLPDLYRQLLSQKEILLADGLSEQELSELETLLPTVSDLCCKLSSYSIQPTLVQSDFHDNNILINEISKKITFIDLGEIVISHPFFSLVGCLRQIKFHHGLTERDEAYLQMKEACLKNFMPIHSKINLLAIAELLWLVYDAAAQYRLRLACDEARFLAFQRHGRLSGSLKEFLRSIIT